MNVSYYKISKIIQTKFLVGIIAALVLVSCTTDPNSPGVEFMPDMYRATGYEAYLKKFDIDSNDFFERNLRKLGYEKAADSAKPSLIDEVDELYKIFKSGLITRKPVKGTIAVGKMPFPIEKGDRSLAKAVRMPIPYTETSLIEGKTYYEVFCVHCHGPKGQGKGSLIQKELFLKPPAYNSKDTKLLSSGEIYYTIFYGKGMMGSHASQIVEEKRWKIVQYVQTLQGNSADELMSGKLKVPMEVESSSNSMGSK